MSLEVNILIVTHTVNRLNKVSFLTNLSMIVVLVVLGYKKPDFFNFMFLRDFWSVCDVGIRNENKFPCLVHSDP